MWEPVAETRGKAGLRSGVRRTGGAGNEWPQSECLLINNNPVGLFTRDVFTASCSATGLKEESGRQTRLSDIEFKAM